MVTTSNHLLKLNLGDDSSSTVRVTRVSRHRFIARVQERQQDVVLPTVGRKAAQLASHDVQQMPCRAKPTSHSVRKWHRLINVCSVLFVAGKGIGGIGLLVAIGGVATMVSDTHQPNITSTLMISVGLTCLLFGGGLAAAIGGLREFASARLIEEAWS